MQHDTGGLCFKTWATCSMKIPIKVQRAFKISENRSIEQIQHSPIELQELGSLFLPPFQQRLHEIAFLHHVYYQPVLIYLLPDPLLELPFGHLEFIFLHNSYNTKGFKLCSN